MGPKVFDGLLDTLRILMDVAGETVPARLIQVQDDLASLCASRPDTLAAAHDESLNRLAASALEVVQVFDADPESQAAWWARAFADQCQAALDDLTFLAPWTVLPVSSESARRLPDVIDEIPTLRELANLDKELLPAMTEPTRRDAGGAS